MVFTLNGLILQLSMNLINLTFQVENVVKCRTGFIEDGLFLKDKTFLGRYPILVSLAKTRSPSPGSVKRQISLKSVDLPVPLGPIKPILSFLRMCRETLSKIALLPNARLTLFRRIIHESLIQRAMKIYHPPLLPPIEGGEKFPRPLWERVRERGNFFG